MSLIDDVAWRRFANPVVPVWKTNFNWALWALRAHWALWALFEHFLSNTGKMFSFPEQNKRERRRQLDLLCPLSRPRSALSNIDRIGIHQCEAIDIFCVPNYEAIEVFGVPQSEAIDAKYVPTLARAFELQKHISGCPKSWIIFLHFYST